MTSTQIEKAKKYFSNVQEKYGNLFHLFSDIVHIIPTF